MSNLLKSSWVVVRDKEARVIDSNKKMEQKLNKIRMNMQKDTWQEEPIHEEEFQEELDGSQVDALLSEDNKDMLTSIKAAESAEGKSLSRVIKAEPVYQGPTPEELVAQAQEQIDSMMAQAQADAEAIKSKAYEAGHQEGYKSGQQECVQQTEKMKRELQQKEEQLEKFYQEKMEELEPQFIDLLTGIYEHIFHVNLSDFREVILHTINHIIGMADSNKDFIIRVSKYDYSFIFEQKEQIMENASANATVEIVKDITMSQGKCMIETGGGIFDCGIDTQLEGLAKELKLLSYEKKNENQ